MDRTAGDAGADRDPRPLAEDGPAGGATQGESGANPGSRSVVDDELAYPTAPGGTGSPEQATQPRLLRAVNRTRGTVLAERLEVADSFGSRFAGLMGRPSLAAGNGLWLPGTGSIHMLFMRFAIDAVFLGPDAPDGARPVVRPIACLRPWIGIGLARGAKGVLELPADTIVATGTLPGDEVVLEAVPETCRAPVPEGAGRRPGRKRPATEP